MRLRSDDRPARLRLIPVDGTTLIQMFQSMDGNHVFTVDILPPDIHVRRVMHSSVNLKVFYLLVESFLFDEIKPGEEIPPMVIQLHCRGREDQPLSDMDPEFVGL